MALLIGGILQKVGKEQTALRQMAHDTGVLWSDSQWLLLLEQDHSIEKVNPVANHTWGGGERERDANRDTGEKCKLFNCTSMFPPIIASMGAQAMTKLQYSTINV